MKKVDKRNTDNEVKRSDLEEGDEVMIEWSPYNWAEENEGYVPIYEAKVDSIHESSGDIRLSLPDGRIITDLGGSRFKVMGPAENSPDVPDSTDIGTGVDRYYKNDL